MKKAIILFFITLLSCITYATDGFIYQLKENQKFEKTLSVDLNLIESLHLVYVKNKDTKKIDIIPFFINTRKEVKELHNFSFEDEPELLSYHKNGHQLTLVTFLDDVVSINDIDVTNGKSIAHHEISDIERPENVFTKNNKTVLMKTDKKTENVILIEITNANKQNTQNIAIPEIMQDKIETIFEENLDVVNTEEFVKNGSISRAQVFYNGEKMFFIFDKKDDENIETIEFDPRKKDAFKITTYTTSELDKIKNTNAFYKDGKLFVVNSGKEDVEMSIFDTKTGTKEKRVSLQNEIAYTLKDIEEREKFIKEAKKNANKPTVTVNETKEGNLAVRIDYVNVHTYNYYNFWWMNNWMMHNWMMQQQMMMNNQMMMGGPNITLLDIDALYFVEESTSVSFVINKNLEIMKDAALETVYRNIDKKAYDEKLSDDKEIKNQSLAFLSDEYHYIYTDRKENHVYIAFKSLDKEQ